MLARLVAVLMVLVAPVIAFGQALADHVPAGSIAYAGWRGAADLGPGYPQSNLKAVLDDSQVADFIDRFMPAVFEKVGQLNPQAGEIGNIVAAIAKPTWQHPTAFFLAGIDMPKGGQPNPRLGILWQAGADGDALVEQLRKLVKQAPVPFPLKVARQHDLVALLMGYENADTALADFAAKPLSGDPEYKAALGHLSVTEPVGAVYIDFQKYLGLIDTVVQMSGDEHAPAQWAKVRDDLGIGSLKHLIVASGFDGKDFGTQAFAEIPAPRTGIFALASGKPLGPEIMAAIPRDVTLAGAGRFDVAGLFDVIHKAVQDVAPNEVGQFDQMLGEIDHQSGVNLREDLIGSLGDEWAYFTDPAIGGRGLASFTFVNHLKDPGKFEQSLARIEDFALKQIQKEAGAQLPVSIHFDTVEVDGMKIHYLAIPLVSPCWVVKDGNLYVAAFPQVAAGAARNVAQKGPSILQNAGFMKIRAQLGQHDPDAFSFADLPQTAPDAYGIWLFISRLPGFGDLFGVKSPPLLLPELDKLTAHLAPAGAVRWVDAEGFHMRAIEPFPGSTILASDPSTNLLMTEPLLVSIMLPALNKSREQANRVKSASNLKQIGLGIAMYSNSHKGNVFPPDLGTVAKEEELPAQVFINPRNPTAAPPPQNPADLAEWVDEHSDYVYIGKGKNAAIPPDEVVAYEKLDENTEGVNVLFGDFHVEFMTIPDAQVAIDKSKVKGKGINGNL